MLGYQEGKQFKKGDSQRQAVIQPTFDGTMSSAEWQFSTTSVSVGREAGGSSAVYKGNDHEDGNGARTVHGPISISLARSLEYLPATSIAVELTPLSHLG